MADRSIWNYLPGAFRRSSLSGSTTPNLQEGAEVREFPEDSLGYQADAGTDTFENAEANSEGYVVVPEGGFPSEIEMVDRNWPHGQGMFARSQENGTQSRPGLGETATRGVHWTEVPVDGFGEHSPPIRCSSGWSGTTTTWSSQSPIPAIRTPASAGSSPLERGITHASAVDSGNARFPVGDSSNLGGSESQPSSSTRPPSSPSGIWLSEAVLSQLLECTVARRTPDPVRKD